VCIGPYSQCNSVRGLAHCAGQIALVPATMKLLESTSLAEHVQLCLRHCHRILLCSKSSLERAVLCTVYTSASHSVEECSDMVRSQLEQDYDVVLTSAHFALVVVQVPRLPRDAPVEVQVVARSDVGSALPDMCGCDTSDEDSDDADKVSPKSDTAEKVSPNSDNAETVSPKSRAVGPNCGIAIHSQSWEGVLQAVPKHVLGLTLYYAASDVEAKNEIESKMNEMNSIARQAVPVSAIAKGAKFVIAGLLQSPA
jgi:enamine deaminase RidA (YjgF/YER057c/UK114 family)